MIVAIGIITTGIVSTVSLVQSTLTASTEASARLAAANLAREGIEAVRHLRDTNWLAGASWEEDLVGPAGNRTAAARFAPGAAPWTLDWTASSLADPETVVFQYGAAAPPELQDLMAQTAGGIAPAEATATRYRRLLELYPVCRDTLSGAETVVTGETASCGAGTVEVGLDARSTVRWNERGTTRSVTAEEKLYDWR